MLKSTKNSLALCCCCSNH